MELSAIKKNIIAALFPDEFLSPEEIQKKYPSRTLKEGAMVTRVGPSPTGPMHIGGVYAALISERLAHQSGGIFYLRIEDTDKKREIKGSIDLMVESLARYGIVTDEGLTASGEEIGAYGPYTQSERKYIYKPFCKLMLERGSAYPCFCTPEQLEEMRGQQDLARIRSGYYGTWATCRKRSDEEILDLITKGAPCVIRFKSTGSFDKKIVVHDLLKGTRELSENDQDVVIVKVDGLPTYHFAHLVDDHLMGTTHVFRGDEWLPSVPLHLQLFESMAWAAPAYGHLMPIQKIDGASKRKLSKRSDPEATISYYDEVGYPEQAVVDYLLNLANSNFEEWRKAHPRVDNREFLLTVERLAQSGGPLLDLAKLEHISKETVAHMTVEEVYGASLAWARTHDEELYALLERDAEYAKKIFAIERHDGPRARKDIGMWSQVKQEIGYFFDTLFQCNSANARQLLEGIDRSDIKAIIADFLERYNPDDSKDQWLLKIRSLCADHGFAGNMKSYKEEPGTYKGTIVDVTKIFRVLLTGRTDTPDLYEVMRVMGRERMIVRLSSLTL